MGLQSMLGIKTACISTHNLVMLERLAGDVVLWGDHPKGCHLAHGMWVQPFKKQRAIRAKGCGGDHLLELLDATVCNAIFD